MALQSTWFRGNKRLQRCLIEDPSHVQKGDQGEHVRLIQGALAALGEAAIEFVDLAQSLYGASTAAAVLAYKRRRQIINPGYQTTADDIVGKLTIRALDKEMSAKDKSRSRLLLAFGATLATPKQVILSEPNNLHAVIWAKQLKDANGANVVNILAPSNATPAANVAVIKRSIAAADGGLLILNVGHGRCLLDNLHPKPDEGAFDLAPEGAMRLEGRTTQQPTGFASAFYADKRPGSKPDSLKGEDEENGSPNAIARLKNFAVFEDLSKAFVGGGLAAVLLATCRVGRATGFLGRVAKLWNTPIIAYRDQFMFYETPGRRTRAILAADKGRGTTRTPGTDTPFGEVMFPLSETEMVMVRP